MTVKNPTAWQTQPISSGPQDSITVQLAANLVDQAGNQLVDQLGNSLVAGTNIPQSRIPIVWSQTGV